MTGCTPRHSKLSAESEAACGRVRAFAFDSRVEFGAGGGSVEQLHSVGDDLLLVLTRLEQLGPTDPRLNVTRVVRRISTDGETQWELKLPFAPPGEDLRPSLYAMKSSIGAKNASFLGDGHRLFVIDFGQPTLVEIDTQAGAIVGERALGSAPLSANAAADGSVDILFEGAKGLSVRRLARDGSVSEHEFLQGFHNKGATEDLNLVRTPAGKLVLMSMGSESGSGDRPLEITAFA